MNYYIVFAGTRHPVLPMGTTRLVWEPQPVGVFRSSSAESACRAAAKKSGQMGSYFAIEGFPWGIEMMDTDEAAELGVDTPETLSKLEQLEARSRELERQAGLLL